MKKLLGLILTCIFTLCIPFSVFADEPHSITSYMWNEKTHQITELNPNDKFTKANDNSIQQFIPENIVYPMSYMEVFDHYESTSNTIDECAKKVQTCSLDNRGSVTAGQLIFKTSSGGTYSGDFSVKFTASGEASIVLVTVGEELGSILTLSRAWSSNTEYGTINVVPAGMQGKLEGYIPAAVTTGYRVFRVYNTTDDSFFYSRKAVSNAKTPLKNDWHFVFTTY